MIGIPMRNAIEIFIVGHSPLNLFIADKMFDSIPSAFSFFGSRATICLITRFGVMLSVPDVPDAPVDDPIGNAFCALGIGTALEGLSDAILYVVWRMFHCSKLLYVVHMRHFKREFYREF